MRQICLFFVLATVSLLIAVPASASENESIKGTWEYQVPAAAYEYSKGQLIIAEKDGELTLVVKFMDGTKIPGEQVKFEDNQLTFGVTLDNEFIKVACLLDDGKLAGEVQSPEGPTQLTATKKKQE
ncbi:hypothetical protein [Sunxiuqinia dokdonensis]|uniref:Uncharacterized protein n=1 Tax=Sunxiuqinia dokdonensis TaxID=1409788 RepID=A0A0L8V2V4_9BACT|nr:hypothetical protein [Sunxiuqinia dokdonensis]KOH42729.1 hypothetical protein NC99_44550 [Sunxiuqinia dokdonensis]